jgi:hypothetical protein
MQVINVGTVKPFGRKRNLSYCDNRLNAFINNPFKLVLSDWKPGAGQLTLCDPAKVGGSVRYHAMESPVGIPYLCQTAI